MSAAVSPSPVPTPNLQPGQYVGFDSLVYLLI